MEIVGTVISYSPSVKIEKQGGGTYDAYELVYRTPENEVKQFAKPITGLKFNKPLASALASIKPNDAFTLTLEKNKADYWEPKSIQVGDVGQAQVSIAQVSGTPQVTSVGSRGASRVTGSTYETPDERAKKQVVIVRQSCLAQAVAIADLQFRVSVQIGAVPNLPDVNHILDIASVLEAHVNDNIGPAAKAYKDVNLETENGE